VAAGHGLFGIAFARRYPSVEVVAVDWPEVLAVAEDNARAAGVGGRYRSMPGSAFEVDWGRGYDLVLLANFLHHFDPPTCERLLARARAALGEGGRAVSVEFVPDDGRTSPPPAAGFSLVMLCSTPGGDVYTFPELDGMLRRAGFSRSELHPLPPSPQHAIISHR
jgi:cyclopropane fatty-acyl-phospholipid synthase-like methyltransferase